MLAQIPFRVPPVFHLRDTRLRFFFFFLSSFIAAAAVAIIINCSLARSLSSAHNKQQLPGSEVQAAWWEETAQQTRHRLQASSARVEPGDHVIEFQRSCSTQDHQTQKKVRPWSNKSAAGFNNAADRHFYTAFVHK